MSEPLRIYFFGATGSGERREEGAFLSFSLCLNKKIIAFLSLSFSVCVCVRQWETERHISSNKEI